MPRPTQAMTLCRCGHPLTAHEHLRRGTDCVWCAPGDCEQFRKPRLLSRLRRHLEHRSERVYPTLVVIR